MVLGQLKATVRRIYSSPPLHGARLVSTVLNTPHLTALWEEEVASMRKRIARMRASLRQSLEALVPGLSAEYLTMQRGMFSYTGLRAEEVDLLREKYGVYLLRSGRMCVAGLNDGNLEHVAQSMATVLRARAQ